MLSLVFLHCGLVYYLYQYAGDIENIQDVAEVGGVLGKQKIHKISLSQKKNYCTECEQFIRQLLYVTLHYISGNYST